MSTEEKDPPTLERPVDARFIHPFTCIVNGPTSSGKSTFVYNLLSRQGDLIDVNFGKIIIFLGTAVKENEQFSKLKVDHPSTVEIVSLTDIFHTRKELIEKFPDYFNALIDVRTRKHAHLEYCIVFDDLMKELSECGLLVNLFSKYSSHKNISVIFITQNLNYKGKGSHSTDSVTIYRNTHVLVLFNNPMDGTALSTIAQKMSPGGFKRLFAMLKDIVERDRYVVIRGSLNVPGSLRFTSNIFQNGPMFPSVFDLHRPGEKQQSELKAGSPPPPHPSKTTAKTGRVGRLHMRPPLSRRTWRRRGRAVLPLRTDVN